MPCWTESRTPEVRTRLILGGARSGKSAYAERLARDDGGPVLYLATGSPSDPEMAAKIRIHQERRPSSWVTAEVTVDAASAIATHARADTTVLIDSLTLLVSNHLIGPDDSAESDKTDQPAMSQAVTKETADLLAAVDQASCRLIVVSDEVGMGLVPPYPLGRMFRDLLGQANQVMAEAAQEVYLLVAGIPWKIKGP